MTSTPQTHEVDPDRLSRGQWSQEFNRRSGEGDISVSYSADTIGLKGKTRTPFVFNGNLWVSIGVCGEAVRAYKLVPIAEFAGDPTDYASKTSECKAARADPNGFYHGMAVTYHKDWFVLCGPPAFFVPGQASQPRLFDAE